MIVCLSLHLEEAAECLLERINFVFEGSVQNVVVEKDKLLNLIRAFIMV